MSPQPTNARKKLLDSSARNPLIYIGLPSKPCGLTAVLNGAGAERECENGEKTCRPAAEVARYEVRTVRRIMMAYLCAYLAMGSVVCVAVLVSHLRADSTRFHKRSAFLERTAPRAQDPALPHFHATSGAGTDWYRLGAGLAYRGFHEGQRLGRKARSKKSRKSQRLHRQAKGFATAHERSRDRATRVRSRPLGCDTQLAVWTRPCRLEKIP